MSRNTFGEFSIRHLDRPQKVSFEGLDLMYGPSYNKRQEDAAKKARNVAMVEKANIIFDEIETIVDETEASVKKFDKVCKRIVKKNPDWVEADKKQPEPSEDAVMKVGHFLLNHQRTIDEHLRLEIVNAPKPFVQAANIRTVYINDGPDRANPYAYRCSMNDGGLTQTVEEESNSISSSDGDNDFILPTK